MNTHQKAVGQCSECAPRLISSEMFFFSPKIQEKKKKQKQMYVMLYDTLIHLVQHNDASMTLFLLNEGSDQKTPQKNQLQACTVLQTCCVT